MNFQIKCKNNLSYTLIEILIALFFIVVLSYLILGSFLNFLKSTLYSRLSLQILSALEDELEIIRVLNYEDVGIIDGWPRGKLTREKIVNYQGLDIKINYYIRNIDNPADGILGGNPNDSAPADYKLVELEGECLNCSIKIKKQTLTTIIAPKNVESSTKNGSLFIQVINASGQAISEANIQVINNATSPPIIINDLTNNQGMLQLIDIPTGTNVYQITVTKEGYSVDKTYLPGANENPNPIIPHQTVIEQSLTTVTFQIDRLANLDLKAINNFCEGINNLNLRLTGQKLIGTNPDIIKNIITTSTNSQGDQKLKLEWDNYLYEILNNEYILAGYNSSSPLVILPGLNYYLRLNIASSLGNSLLVSVLDNENNPLNEAEIELSKSNFEKILYTKTENIFHNNWLNNYSEISQNININKEGLTLKNINSVYPTGTDEWLISKTIDLGTSSNVELLSLKWEPINQPPQTEVKFQIAVNNDNTTWNFIGPDGTNNSYFNNSPSSLTNIPKNKRYLRYKIYLKTENENLTPLINEISLRFTSDCLANGQVLFSNLPLGVYNLLIKKNGFQIFTTSTNIQNRFKEIKVNLQPE
ncbi:MAG: hypothetical protein NZ866_01335 [Patescibacteria group bacterium]|nr:hypothetical protein [Patescibacteria group bacterium]